MRQLSAGVNVESYETARLHRHGRSVDVLLSASPIYDPYGVIVGAPRCLPPTRRGFGSRLIERLLAAELNGTVKITYDPKGVACEIDANLLSEWGQRSKAH
ncbi:hypothetical protein N185_32600 [Sinorhizobium sp. GW3]|nr:hypothetical protein N185_32600 [Sinorhizobium sp. GW3]